MGSPHAPAGARESSRLLPTISSTQSIARLPGPHSRMVLAASTQRRRVLLVLPHGGRRLERLPSEAFGNLTALSVRGPRRLRVGSRFRRGHGLALMDSPSRRRAASCPCVASPVLAHRSPPIRIRGTTSRRSRRRLAWIEPGGPAVSMTHDGLLSMLTPNERGRAPQAHDPIT